MKTFFGTNRPQHDLGRRSLHSGVISVASRAVNIVVQIGSTIVLYRLLSPTDVGLVAMVSVLTGFAPVLMDLGTRDAAVQKAEITEEEVSALFWLTVGIGGTISLLLAVCSPWIAAFYHEAKLEQIALVSALTFIISAGACQHSALLRRAMMFQKIAVIEVGANLFSAVGAIAMVFSGSGYWALVAKPILSATFTLAGVWWCCPWLPGIPRLTAGVKEMVRFGLNVTGFTMADYVGRAADRIALGRAVGATELGYYQNAFFVYDNSLGLLSISLHTVAVASLSKLREDLGALKRAWATALSSLAFYAMPAFALLAVVGQDCIVILLGEKWLYAGSLVSVLAMRGIPHVVERTLGWLHVPAGRADRWMRWGVIGSAVQIGALLCGLPFGTLGVAVAYAVSMYLVFVPAIVYAGRPLGIGVSDVVKAVGPQLVGALALAAAGFALRYSVLSDVQRPWRIVLLFVLGLAIYSLVVVGFFRIKKPLDVVRSLFRDVVSGWIGRRTALGTGTATKED